MGEMVQFLSEAWAGALSEALNGDNEFKEATRRRESLMLFRIHDGPTGDASYSISLDHGATEVRLGEPDTKPDMTFDMSYDVAARIAQGTLGGREAVTSKQMTTDVGLLTLMKFAPVFIEQNRVASSLPIEY